MPAIADRPTAYQTPRLPVPRVPPLSSFYRFPSQPPTPAPATDRHTPRSAMTPATPDANTPAPDAGRLIRMTELRSLTGLSASTLYALQRPGASVYDPTFPKAVKLTAKAVGYPLGEVRAWIASRARGVGAPPPGARAYRQQPLPLAENESAPTAPTGKTAAGGFD